MLVEELPIVAPEEMLLERPGWPVVAVAKGEAPTKTDVHTIVVVAVAVLVDIQVVEEQVAVELLVIRVLMHLQVLVDQVGAVAEDQAKIKVGLDIGPEVEAAAV